ncbi:UTRA domain-containing protein [Streptomyces celluloflavus]|uniref:UTRA domain-containing protein n=1 Tax=Streptomyces celluloflavus TaxID=58344 RepID=UPI0036C86E58
MPIRRAGRHSPAGFVYRSRRNVDEAPYSIVRSYLVHGAVTEAQMEPVDIGSPWGDACQRWLVGAGVQLDHVVERLTARPPTVEEARALGLTPGVSVLAIQRSSFDVRGVVVETGDLVMSGDRVAAVYSTSVAHAHQLR